MIRIVLFGVIAAAIILAAPIWLWLAPEGRAGADPDNARQVAAGAQIYAADCASCHGRNLEGQPDWRRRLPDGGLPAPPHDASGHTWHHPDDVLFDITLNGGAASAPPGFKSNMPGFKGKLTEADIWAVLAFIKSRWPAEIRKRQEMANQRAR